MLGAWPHQVTSPASRQSAITPSWGQHRPRLSTAKWLVSTTCDTEALRMARSGTVLQGACCEASNGSAVLESLTQTACIQLSGHSQGPEHGRIASLRNLMQGGAGGCHRCSDWPQWQACTGRDSGSQDGCCGCGKWNDMWLVGCCMLGFSRHQHCKW